MCATTTSSGPIQLGTVSVSTTGTGHVGPSSAASMTNAGVAAPARAQQHQRAGAMPGQLRDARLLRGVRGGAHLGARGGRRPQDTPGVKGREGPRVAEKGVVEPGHGPSLIARSISSTGMPSSTG